MPRYLLATCFVVAALIACGGKELGPADPGAATEDATDAAGDASNGSGGGGEHSSATEDAILDSGVECEPAVVSTSRSGGTCAVTATENCSDGTTFAVQCDCRTGTCTCSAMNATTGSDRAGIAYAGGCPSCSVSVAWEVCKFPH